MSVRQSDFHFPIPEKVQDWGMAHHCYSPVFRPETEKEIRKVFQFASKQKFFLAFRGGGCSYGDSAINNNGIILDLSNLNKIIDFDPNTGILNIQSGLSMQALCEFSLERGFWPPVVSSSTQATFGGSLSMNIHGKNGFSMGTIGDHVLDFKLLCPSGNIYSCSREENSELFHAVIGGMGLLGVILEVRLKLKKIHSSELEVKTKRTENLEETLDYFERAENASDYLYAWVDGFSSGRSTGRGFVFRARHLEEGEDTSPTRFSIKNHTLGENFLD